LTLAVRYKAPEIFGHDRLLSNVMKKFMQKDLSNAPKIVNRTR
jgi:hypothetical protein